MPNLYGVANPVVNLGWYTTIGGANVTCPAGVETNVIQSGPITALDRGIYYPFCVATLVFNYGATLPSSLIFGLRLNNGADLVQMAGYTPASAANSAYSLTFVAVGPPTTTAFIPPGSNIQVSAIAQAQSVTCSAQNYSGAILGILRAADQ